MTSDLQASALQASSPPTASGPARPAPWARTSLSLGARAASPAEGDCSPSTRAQPPSKTVRPKVRTPHPPLRSGSVSLDAPHFLSWQTSAVRGGAWSLKQWTLGRALCCTRGQGWRGSSTALPEGSDERAGQALRLQPGALSPQPPAPQDTGEALSCTGRKVGRGGR